MDCIPWYCRGSACVYRQVGQQAAEIHWCVRNGSGSPGIALGGLECTTYDTKRLSLLVHWTTRKAESEVAAYELFEKLRNVSGLDIGDTHIAYLRLMVPEPQDVGTDDGGVYEYVIWLDLIYERK